MPADRPDTRYRNGCVIERPDRRPGRLHALRIGHEAWGPDHRVDRPDPRSFGLLLVLSGRGWFEGDRGRVDLEPGMVFAHAPGHPYAFGCDPADPLEVLIATGCGPDCADRFATYLPAVCHAWKIANAHAVALVYQNLLDQALTRQTWWRRLCDQHFATLILTVGQGSRARAVAGGSRAERTYAEALRYIDRNYVRLRTTGEVAAHCGVGVAHLCRLFRRFGDETPHAHLVRLKMEHAAHLLTTSSITVQQVAARLDYPDPFSFSKAFKKWLGSSPQRYRQER